MKLVVSRRAAARVSERFNLFLPLMIVSSTLLLSACGGTKRSSNHNGEAGTASKAISTRTKLDACALITQEEAAAALGEQVGLPKQQVLSEATENTAEVSRCSFEAVASAAKTVSILARRSSFKDSRPSSVRETLAGSGIEVQDVPGVGDTAFWGSNQLHVFKGDDLYLIISIFGIKGEAEALERTKSLAQKALARV